MTLLTFSVISYIVTWVILTGIIYIRLKEDGPFTLYDLLFVCEDKYSLSFDSIVNTLSIGRYIPYWNLCVLFVVVGIIIIMFIGEFFEYMYKQFKKLVEPRLSKITFNKPKK